MITKIISLSVFALFLFLECKTAETVQQKSDVKQSTVYGCIEGNCKNGSGTFTWENGSKYTGEFKNGSMHGQGTFYFGAGNAGTKYVGEFKNGFIDGIGTWAWSNGEKYIGESKYNKMHGKGTYYYTDGTVKKGTWYNDKYVNE